MSAPDVESTPRFEPPGPGSWDLESVHLPRPVTRYFQEIQPEALRRGFHEFAGYYGLLLNGLTYAYVNGFAYMCVEPVPPEQVPERLARVEEVLAGRLWRDQLRDWDERFKPASIEKHHELQAVEPDGLSDEELVAYLERCREHHREMTYQHMRHSGAATIPVGDLLAHVGDWTGLPQAELVQMLSGASPVSAGASEELERMVRAIRTDAAAQEILGSNGDPGDALERLRGLGGETGQAVGAYLDLTGYRLLDGFDIAEPYALEMPDALLRAIRAQLQATDAGGAQDEAETKIAEIREKVPPEHRDAFDELVAEARLVFRLRDERGVYSDIWASGIMRRAVLAAGRRVAARQRIQEPEHFLDASFDEMRSLVLERGGPSAEELAARFRWRTSHTARDAPAHLGEPAPPPPDLSGLPPAAARVMRAMAITMESIFAPSTEAHEEHMLRGLGASGGVYEGPARLVAGPEEFGRIMEGDVLVTGSTSEAFNILLPLLGALVTDSGGLLSHPAIVSREYGIPGVVGTREATQRISDGMRVQVNGDTGEVRVLA